MKTIISQLHFKGGDSEITVSKLRDNCLAVEITRYLKTIAVELTLEEARVLAGFLNGARGA